MPGTSKASSPEPHANTSAEDRAQPARGSAGTRFVFVDTEATGLDHRRHELTEVSWIVRFEDGSEIERCFFPEHTTDGADADALELTQHAARIAPQPKTPASEWLARFLEDAEDAVLVGAVPDFDARHLERMCHKLGLEPSWDHHLLDVETLALPLIADGPEAPRSLAKTCAALGIPHDKDQAHGALYDARQAKLVFDRVWDVLARLRREAAPLPPPVPREHQDAATSPHARAQTTRSDVQATSPDVQASSPDVQATRPDVPASNPDVQATRPDVPATSSAPAQTGGSAAQAAGSSTPPPSRAPRPTGGNA
jgi:DNA polymerase III epsilon subunit-like protein